MGIKSNVIGAFANRTRRKIESEARQATHFQKKTFDDLILRGATTLFGKEHGLNSIKDYHSFSNQVPIRDYEDFKPYVEKIIEGNDDVLWPGKPLYFAKTSGTTSGVKYIPITKESI